MPDVTRLHTMDAVIDVAVSGAQAALLSTRIGHEWARCLANDAVGGVPHATLGVRLEEPEALREVLDDLSTRLTRALIAANTGRLLMFHAAALADPRTGRAAVLVAPSGTGKTTATRVLGRSLGYLSDETAAIDEQGRLHAYPKPLSLLTPTGRPKDQVAPEDLALLPAPVEARAAAVLLLARAEDGPTTPVLEDVPVLDALALLAEQSSSLSRLDRGLHRIADLLESTGGLRRLHYREASSLPDVVGELVA